MSLRFARWLGGLAIIAGMFAWPGAGWARVGLVASGDRVLVLDEDEVRLFTGDGRLLRRLSARAASGAAGASEPPDQRRQIMELYDVPTELRDSPEVEDLVDDELSLSQRAPGGATRAPPEEGMPALAAADGRGGFWVALGGRLHQLAPEGVAVRRAPRPPGLRAMSVDDAGLLWMATRAALLAGQDGNLRKVADLDRDPTHLAVAPAGSWLAWADQRGVQVLRGGARTWLLAGAAVRDLQACGDQLLLLAEDGLHLVVAQGPARRVSGPLPARSLACSRSDRGAPWIAVGAGLLSSMDAGLSFRFRADVPAGPILGVALAGQRIWLLRPEGIETLPLVETSISASPPPPPAQPAAELPGRIEVLGRGWGRLLPRLTLAASYHHGDRRRDFRALALAELPLGGGEPVPTVAPLARPQLALAEQLPPEQGPTQAPSTRYPPAAPAPYPALSPYPPPDRDARCLPPTRAQAVTRAQAEAERARSLVARAGRAAWLPELRLRAEKRMGRSESLDVRGPSAMPGRDTFGLDASNAMLYEVRAIWDLPRLVFSPEEGAAVQQALRMADMRREIESQVNRVYFERRRLLIHPAGNPPDEATGALLRVEELEAELDALSAGAFSRCRASGIPGPGP
jgi:hypothetical protein